ncbi:MAG: SoxR reducing system RseC family protein [Bacteroidales bacterium]|jgi:sigma-E factor negative regulatory protein RseC|nr:SoxR reducing system RseC family protein [Bacteroidales bacterium]
MKKIKHPGIIKHIDKTSVQVEIIALSACASCGSKSLCQMSESKEKLIDVPVANLERYAIGQSVNVVMQEELGLKAAFLAYVMPFLVCMGTLFGLSALSESELVYGGSAIVAVVVYYVLLKLCSARLTKSFVWYLE